jgi:hypothetical protein
MAREVVIRSSRDGVTLTLSNFVPENGSPTSESFLVEIKSYDVRSEARASTFMTPDLGEFFASMANEWRGWSGEKTWATLEGEFELAATADSLGHVRLGFFLRPANTGFNWELRGALEREAGQLLTIAHEVRSALGQDAL